VLCNTIIKLPDIKHSGQCKQNIVLNLLICGKINPPDRSRIVEILVISVVNRWGSFRSCVVYYAKCNQWIGAT